MAICEDCGVTFDPPKETAEVTSARVLCMNCEARRLMAKAARSNPAPKPVTGGGGPGAKPSQQARAPARPASVGLKTAAKPAQPATVRTMPAAVGRGQTGRPAAAVRTKILIENEGNKALMIGWIIAGVLVVGGLGVLLYVKSVKDAERADLDARELAIKTFKDEMNRFDLSKEDQANAALKHAKDKESLWANATFAPDITSIISRASVSLSSLKSQKELRASIENVEKSLKDSAGQSAESLSVHNRTLNELEPKAALVGPEFVQRIKQALVEVTQAYAIKLHDEARDGAKGGAKGRTALAGYTKAEDELLRLLQKLQKEPDKVTDDLLKAHYADVIRESDQLCSVIFTPDVVNNFPWKDLLTGEQVKNWVASKGFEHRIENGTLQVVSDPQSTKTGVLTIGDKEAWRDFVLHIEFVVDKGTPELVFRAPRQMDMKRVETFNLASTGLEQGKHSVLDVSFIGSKLVVKVPNSEVAPYERTSDTSKGRKGGIGLVIPEGTKLKVTQMKVKELR